MSERYHSAQGLALDLGSNSSRGTRTGRFHSERMRDSTSASTSTDTARMHMRLFRFAFSEHGLPV